MHDDHGTISPPRREHFIPLRKHDLIRALLADLPDEADREAFHRLCRRLDAAIHADYHARIDELKRQYAPFDPDRDTQPLYPVPAEERERMENVVLERIASLAERANFRRLTPEEFEAALERRSEWGVNLRVETEAFDRLAIFTRGERIDQRSIRRWQNWFRPEPVQVPIYQRLLVVFRLQPHPSLAKEIDTQSLHLKLFKNIPQADVEMLLPCTRFRMTLLDHGKILLPTVSGLAMAVFKIVKGALMLVFAGMYGILAFAVFVWGTIGFGVRSFLSYLRTKDKYHLNLTRHLYYQKLDSNSGALFRMLDEAEEQEFRETALAYWLLWREAGENGWTVDELDAAAERHLSRVTGLNVDFEIRDAVEKLERFGLAEPDGTRWRAVPLQSLV